MFHDSTPLLTKREAALMLTVSVTTLDRWVKAGHLQSTKLGKCVRFNLCDLTAYIAVNRTQLKEGV